MFVNRGWRRRLQATVGPGHDRRRACGAPDHEHRRDIQVADAGRDGTRRDPATGDTARDPATGDTARDPATGDTARDDHFLPDDVGMSDGATARWCDCPVVRPPDDVLLCPVMFSYVRLCPAARTLPHRMSQRCHWLVCSV